MKKIMMLCAFALTLSAYAAKESSVKYVWFQTTDPNAFYELVIEHTTPFDGKKPEDERVVVKSGPGGVPELKVQKGWMHRVRSGEGYIKGILVEGPSRYQIDDKTIEMMNAAIDVYLVDETGHPADQSKHLNFIINSDGKQGYTVQIHKGRKN